MTKDNIIRRSYRLKDKPSPNYDYQNYLKKLEVPHCKASAMKRDITNKKRKLAAVNKKYDDIFDTVVESALEMTKQSRKKYYAAKRAKQKRKYSEVVESSEGTDSEKSDICEDDDIVVIEDTNLDDSIQEIPVIEIDKEPFRCGCGQRFEQHIQCHQHMFAEHGDDELFAECLECGHRLDDVRTHHACHVCGSFAENLEDHLVSHYRNCTAKSAVMECRFCTRQFFTVKEVVAHEKEKHILKTVRKSTQYYKCDECHAAFQNQDLLMVHYPSHINVVLLFDRITDLQYKVHAERAECPFCRIHVSSRKTFRCHVLKQHFAACKSIVAMSADDVNQPSDLEVKKEIEELIREVTVPRVTIKKEVKEEVHDEGYPVC